MKASWSFLVLAATVSGGLLVMPERAAAQNAAGSKSDDYFNFIELNAYGGYGDYAKFASAPTSKIEGGGLMGARVTENIWNYFSLEQDAGFYSYHIFRFRGPIQNGLKLPEFPLHIYQGSFNGVLHVTPRTSRVRPFVTVGIGAAGYVPNGSARTSAQALPPSAGFANFGSRSEFEANYGGGLKVQAGPRFGLRFDVRGYVGFAPQLGLSAVPVNGSAYLPSNKLLNGVEATGGVTFYFGHIGEKAAPPPTAPPPPPPPPAPLPHSLNTGTISASSTSVCPGDAVRLSSDASDPQGHRLNYQWSVNGNNQGQDNSSYVFTPGSSGDFRVGLHITDTGANAANAVDANPISIHVGAYNAPAVSGLTADPSTLERNQTARLHVNATGSECSGTLSYNWAASEGTITGTGPDVQFNPASVSFNEGDRSRPQSKQVTVTATVRDSKGGSGTASTNMTVNLPAEVKHFGDVVFPKDSARVNNCGKRVLIEQLYPLLTANSNYDVVLVGHIDSSEAPRGRSARNRGLDRNRVMQTAAVLSGGTGTCGSLDAGRIKGAWVGAAQETESLPTSCAVSTAAPKERRGAAVEDSSEAKNPRVEIWLVPRGMSLPPAARNASDLPGTELKRIGCPR